MTRVIHTGDTHIGYQQYHSPARRRDFLDAFEQVVDDAVAEPVDAVVHAGDLFHDRRPELRDILGTISALRRLRDAGIPFLAVVGNHESTRGAQWLDLFERLNLATRLCDDPHVVGDTAFYGLDHVPKSRRDDLEYDFTPHDATYAVLVAHGLFTPFAHADWETETVLDESNVAFDAVLLGDNHKPDTAEVDETWVTYCGSTERASASETEGRGYNLVEFGGETTDDGVDIRRRALDTRPFAFVSVDLREDEGVDRVREQVRQHDLEDAVVLVELTGEGDPVTPASVEEFASEQGALVARVTDRRDLDTESELSVSFADPDDAVRERIDDLGLSAAALDVDETVRASKVADSNVRATVESRVQTLVDDDLSAFEAASPDDTGDGDDSDGDEAADALADGATAEVTADDDTETDGTDEGTPEDGDPPDQSTEGRTPDVDADPGTPADETSDDEPADETSDDGPADETSDDGPAEEVTAEAADDEATDDTVDRTSDDTTNDDEATGGTDGQVTMEDYL